MSMIICCCFFFVCFFFFVFAYNVFFLCVCVGFVFVLFHFEIHFSNRPALGGGDDAKRSSTDPRDYDW